MAYMSTEQAAKIRQGLKEAFPASEGWKLSVKKSSGNLGIDVTFLQGPHQFRFAETEWQPGNGNVRTGEMVALNYGQINPYHYRNGWHDDATVAVIDKAMAVITADHWDKSDIMSDYFHCAFYYDLSVGTWDKPYKRV